MSEAKLKSLEATNQHIAEVKNNIDNIIELLHHRAYTHDASKLIDPELDTFARYGDKLKSCTYGSSEYFGYLKEMDAALQHHYSVNRHHPQHFKDGIRGMNLIDLIEMICDWLASTKRHDNGNIDDSIDINQKRFGYTDELKQILHNTVDYLRTEKK